MTSKEKRQLYRFLNNMELTKEEVVNQHFLLSIEKDDELLELYLILGADVNIENNKAMKHFVDIGNLEKIKMLQKYNADLNVDLTKAIKAHNVELVDYLLDAGSPIAPSYLNTAISVEDKKIIQSLLEHGDEVSYLNMKKAFYTSIEIVKMLLPYTDGKLPERTFDNGDCIWGNVEGLPAESLVYLMDVLDKESHILSNILDSKCLTVKVLDRCLGGAVLFNIGSASYEDIKLVIEKYEEKNKNFDKVSTIYANLIQENLLKNVKNIEELNKILLYLKEKGLLSAVGIKDLKFYWSSTYRICTLETVKILDLPLTRELFIPAIRKYNSEFIAELLAIGIKPEREDIEEAVREYNNSGRAGGNKEKSYEILQMLIKES